MFQYTTVSAQNEQIGITSKYFHIFTWQDISNVIDIQQDLAEDNDYWRRINGYVWLSPPKKKIKIRKLNN